MTNPPHPSQNDDPNTTKTHTQKNAGFCKPGTTAAKYGAGKLSCPEGFTMEKDLIGVTHCVKRTKQPCPSGTTLGADGQCCPTARCGAADMYTGRESVV